MAPVKCEIAPGTSGGDFELGIQIHVSVRTLSRHPCGVVAMARGFFGWYELHSQSVLDAIDHCLTFKRLAEKTFGTCRHHPLMYAFVLECCDEDDRRSHANIAQDMEQLHSTHSVHLHVGYQAVDFNKIPLRKECFCGSKSMDIEPM